MVVIADASPPPNCKGCAEPIRESQSQNPFKPSWVRVPFRAAQQYLVSVCLSQFCMPIFFWSYNQLIKSSTAPEYDPCFALCTWANLRLEPIIQNCGHDEEVQVRSVQLPRP